MNGRDEAGMAFPEGIGHRFVSSRLPRQADAVASPAAAFPARPLHCLPRSLMTAHASGGEPDTPKQPVGWWTVMMSLESVPPKYAQLVQTLQRSIAGGRLSIGHAPPQREPAHPRVQRLPSHRGRRSSRAARAGLDRVLARQGAICTRPPGDGLHGAEAPGQAYLTRPKTDSTGEVVAVGAAAVPNRVGVLLDVQPRTKTFVRRRLITREGEPTELVSLWGG